MLQHPAQIGAFIAFATVVAGTPGPGNALLTTIGARIGIRRGLPSLLGQATGMATMLLAITLGPGEILLAHPLILASLKWAGAVILCWMAWRIATADVAVHHSGNARAATAGFVSLAAFQWINPKGWLVGVAAIATFLDRQSGSAASQAIVFAILFMLVAIPSCLPWLAFGAALQRYVRGPRAGRILNVALAALLVASTITLLLVHV